MSADRGGVRLEVHGTVQGVGYRPFVYRLARTLGVDGTVRNDGGTVVIEAGGAGDALEAMALRLAADAPPRARVAGVSRSALPCVPAPGSGFRVADSVVPSEDAGSRDVPPDFATCPSCVAELFDPADRRFRYPFLNCTDCGPRATIIDELPYDRARTAMRRFPLCARCAREYADPADRRFHAEPVACPACGPRLRWGGLSGEAALASAEAVIVAGGIVALKGLGGYQLVSDASNERAVARLRRRKHRPAKPLAVMVRDLAAARLWAEVDEAEAATLSGPARPIALLRSRGVLAPSVHPAVSELGLFLPTTPLHHLLLRDLDRPLIVTSGNASGEAILISDEEAIARLGGIADGFLAHDRPIRSRYDDSVTRRVAGRDRLVRRARGYAPDPLSLPVPSPTPLLAVGAQLKHTFTLATGSSAVVGPHTGDLEDAATLDAFRATCERLQRLTDVRPEVVVHDLHPGYLSTEHARSLRLPAMAVQHHHAHIASCLAEHRVTRPVVGVAYDGLGLGDDGTLWGGEVLIADLVSYRRFGRFATVPLPGGAAAVRRPVRTAISYLLNAGLDAPSFLGRLDPREVAVVTRMVERGVNSPPTSSAGRLFDAVAALLGVRDDNEYEGQAAVELESAASGAAPPLAWRLVPDAAGLLVYDVAPTLAELIASDEPVGVLSARFHATVAAVTVELCSRARERTGLATVCLSGGVFANRRLTEAVLGQLSARGFATYLNERVPCNDGGISYGQAAVAAARLARG